MINSVKDAAKVLGLVLLVVLALGTWAYVAGAGQRELAARVDMNAIQAAERGQTVLTRLVQDTYVDRCLLFVPPVPERTIEDLETCAIEATVLDYDDWDRIDAVLVRNLRARA